MSRKNRRKPRYVLEEEARARPSSDQIATVNVQALSPASRRCLLFPGIYWGRRYQCIGCHADCVYTASDQKHDYEVKKFHIWTLRTRCEKCHQEWGDLRAEFRQYPQQLRDGVTHDEAARMHAAMERYRRLNGGRFDRALYDRIAKFRIAGASDRDPNTL